MIKNNSTGEVIKKEIQRTNFEAITVEDLSQEHEVSVIADFSILKKRIKA